MHVVKDVRNSAIAKRFSNQGVEVVECFTVIGWRVFSHCSFEKANGSICFILKRKRLFWVEVVQADFFDGVFDVFEWIPALRVSRYYYLEAESELASRTYKVN